MLSRPELDRATVEFVNAVIAETARARSKFPSAAGSMTALTEEVGELAKAMLDESWQRVYCEAVQVAAMALRVATEGDSTLADLRDHRQYVKGETQNEP